MDSLPRNLLLFLIPICLAWGCNLNDNSLTGEEQALCFLTVLRHYRERINGANREPEYSSEDLYNSNEVQNDFIVDDDDDGVDVLGDDDDEKMAAKRGKLDQNFLRFGRFAVRSPYSDKRGALDRNFLRFGRSTDHLRNKRAVEVASGPGIPYANYKSEMVGSSAIPSQRSLHLVKGILSPEKMHLIRELSRKRGALERNFLRFGRSDEDHVAEDRHQLTKRGSLDRNFLRFGRRDGYNEKKSALDRNFLRFGRNYHEDNNNNNNNEGDVPESKRGSLDRNFLRFGKSDASFDQSSHHASEKDEGVKRSALDRNFLRFGRDPLADAKRSALDRNFLRFGKRNFDSDAEENEESADVTRDLMSALYQKRDVNHQTVPKQEENHVEEEKMDTMEPQAKRGSLDKNFLRFGRRQYDRSTYNRKHYPNQADSSKRGSLDRNFLRFGKRNEMDTPLHNTRDDGSNVSHTDHDQESNVTMTLAA